MKAKRVNTSNKQLTLLNQLNRQIVRQLTSGKKLFQLTPGRIIILGFLGLVFFGGILLWLPISSNSGISAGFADAFFTSVSAVCDAGLVVTDTNLQWSYFGKTVILLLIQLGALGIMGVFTVFLIVARRNLSMTDRFTLQEAVSNYSLTGMGNTFKKILTVTLMIETLGAVCFAFELVPIYGFASGIRKSIFHSVSAFCNAGFDIFGTEANPFASLSAYQGRPFFLLITSLLMIIGGLGFIIWRDVAVKRRFSKYTLYSKLVIIATAVLLIAGTFLFFLFEYQNPGTLSNLSLALKLENAFFQSVTTRTGGFYILPPGGMTDASQLLTIILMFIGGASASTAGGVKVTTICVIFLAVKSFAKGRRDAEVFDKRISERLILKSVAVIFLSAGIVILSAMVLSYHQAGGLLQSLFEVTSAFGSVGLTTGSIPELSVVGKVTLMLTMFIGRVGPLTVIVAFTLFNDKRNLTYRYPEGEITVG